MPTSKRAPIPNCAGQLLCLLWLGLAPITLTAQPAMSLECRSASDPIIETVRQVTIDATWEGGTFDGGGGIDTFRWQGPGFFLPRPGRLMSLEVINLQNEVFDTIVVNAEMILSNEAGSIEILADWFDQIMLDPMVEWERSIDAAFSGQLFSTNVFQQPVVVRTRLDDTIISPPQMMMQTREGPLGQFSVATSDDPEIITSEDGSSTSLIWPEGGFITPDFADIDPNTALVTLNIRNQRPDTVVIDHLELSGTTPRQIILESDPSDRLIMPQRGCWQRSNPDQDGRDTITYNQGQPNEVRLSDAQNLRSNQIIPVFTQGIANAPGYRHLSADSRYTLDAINLRNGGKDILIIRNDGRLPRGLPVYVEGDEGLDEIWFEGSAGWDVRFQNLGVVFTAPFSARDNFSVALAPGLKFAVLPTPDFLTDPDMLSLRAYPGLRDEARDATALHVTRAGFVGFSATQLTNIENIVLSNGAANVIRLTPETFSKAGMNVVISGDKALDGVLTKAMPEPTNLAGRVVWRIERPDGQTQTITATDMAYVQTALSD